VQQYRSNVRLCRKDEISTQNSFDIVAVFGNKVECCFDIVAKNGNNVEATFDIVAFDNVASTLLLVWTGLNGLVSIHLSVRISRLSLTLIERAAQTQRDSAGGNVLRGQRTFRPNILVIFLFGLATKLPQYAQCLNSYDGFSLVG